MYTRISGPPKAGHENEPKTLIRINVYFVKICVFGKLDFENVICRHGCDLRNASVRLNVNICIDEHV